MVIDRATHIIKVFKADTFMTLIIGTLYEMDTDGFRLALKDDEDGVDGMGALKTHDHFAPYTVAGVTYAQKFEILAPYSLEFEDGQYSVRLVGSNTNLFDVEAKKLVQNQVQVIAQNSAGLISVDILTQADGVEPGFSLQAAMILT